MLGLGTSNIAVRKACRDVTPMTRAQVKIEASNTIKFIPGKVFGELLSACPESASVGDKPADDSPEASTRARAVYHGKRFETIENAGQGEHRWQRLAHRRRVPSRSFDARSKTNVKDAVNVTSHHKASHKRAQLRGTVAVGVIARCRSTGRTTSVRACFAALCDRLW